MSAPPPILWSFRRCPYAIRARLAVLSAEQKVELREITLKAKPQAFLYVSPSATVPTLQDGETVLDESLDIMKWALARHDPEGLLAMPGDGWDLIAENDGPFKAALDHTKYAVRYPDLDPVAEREKAAEFVRSLDARLKAGPYLFGKAPTLADLALFPFIRQFAFIDRTWFDAQPWPNVLAWLNRFLAAPDFARVMVKAPQWQADAAPVQFGGVPGSENHP